jgi:hypothetical protein
VQQLRDELLAQEFISEQFSDQVRAPLVPVAQLDAGGAITGIVSNTLVVGGKTGTTQNVELPQPLAPTSDPTFDDVTCDVLTCNILDTVNDATSRSNLGLGGLSTQNPGAAVANTGTGVSNPPTQAEVTAIRDKLNELLNSLRTAGIIAT